MKKLLLIMSVLCVTHMTCYGQSASDTITIKKAFGGYQFFQGEKQLTVNQLVNTLETNDEAYQQMKAAKSSYSLSMVFGCAGGFMLGWQLGTAAGGGEPNWGLAAAGAGLIVVTIPITSSFNKKATQAVNTYNNGLQTSSFWDKRELNISVTTNGLGLALKF